MDSEVISEKLKELLAGKQVRAAVFTTYSFDPEFFELEVIPLLLPGNIAYSSDPRVKTFQVREALRDSGVVLDVFYDLNLYREQGQSSPKMEYGCHGVYRENSAFHAKALYILAYDEEWDVECLLVGAGSNNLTFSGWWDNIECQHWQEVYSGYVPLLFVNKLKEDIAYLRAVPGAGYERTALDQIDGFLAGCASANGEPPVPYYNLASIEKRASFKQFLTKQAKELWSYSNWTLEIISPYFARQPDSDVHDFFFSLGVQEIHVLLPQNQDGEALVDQEYFDHINAAKGIEWAEWAADAGRALGVDGKHYRRLHAKVYHFYNGMQSWVFVGSVNFSKQAMTGNVEAGFLAKLPAPQKLLTPVEDPNQVERFSPPDEPEPGVLEGGERDRCPPIYLSYDWKEEILRGDVDSKRALTIQVLNTEGAAVVDAWRISQAGDCFDGDVGPLQQLLKNGSLVRVAARDDSGTEYPEQTVLLQQTGWSHKPLSVPDLSAEQILAIYADLAPERRQLLLMNAQIRKLVMAGEAGEMTLDESSEKPDQFFAEFAELFQAFKQLKVRLLEARETGKDAQVDYYLTGTGVDSLPTLVRHATDQESSLSAATAYLVLLSTRDIYRMKEFRECSQVKKHSKQLAGHLRDLKASGRIRLEDNSPEKRDRFFAWFEEQFSRDYRTKVPR
ncbi:phospholipase D family protein [Wenzhouxiangella sediminis]|uniref:Phospholipase D-like domain-containing protein n=1 Tax=Wenzhouxiangella sediminis TaxID=1792836 RepID=A0A3E1K5U4_9GAMM|nr:phospholipase D family protein [Wenzhouxiangella sediminis]RFF29407.1 hypothetical protein DZC52_13255 [Wenzhouxiangella sediminis]